jgi:energy-converting hydrogenase Eha subunit H
MDSMQSDCGGIGAERRRETRRLSSARTLSQSLSSSKPSKVFACVLLLAWFGLVVAGRQEQEEVDDEWVLASTQRRRSIGLPLCLPLFGGGARASESARERN